MWGEGEGEGRPLFRKTIYKNTREILSPSLSLCDGVCKRKPDNIFVYVCVHCNARTYSHAEGAALWQLTVHIPGTVRSNSVLPACRYSSHNKLYIFTVVERRTQNHEQLGAVTRFLSLHKVARVSSSAGKNRELTVTLALTASEKAAAGAGWIIVAVER